MHQDFRRRGTGSDADAIFTGEPIGINLQGIVDHVSGNALLFRDFAQTVRVRAVRAADHNHDIDLRRHELDGFLAIRGRVTDVAFFWLGNVREFFLERSDHVRRVIDRQRGLRYISEHVGIYHAQTGDIGQGFDEIHAGLGLAHRAFDFRMAIMANHDDFAAFTAHFRHFHVYLRHQRTGRIKDLQATLACFLLHRL